MSFEPGFYPPAKGVVIAQASHSRFFTGFANFQQNILPHLTVEGIVLLLRRHAISITSRASRCWRVYPIERHDLTKPHLGHFSAPTAMAAGNFLALEHFLGFDLRQ